MHNLIFLLTESIEPQDVLTNSSVIDWSSTAAWLGIFVTLAISIITPAVTTYLNNQFQLKIKKEERLQKDQEFLYEKKLSAYRDFLQSVGKSLHYTSRTNLLEIGKNIYELYLYLPEEHWHHLDSLTASIYKEDFDTAQIELIEISKILSIDLNSKINKIDEQTPS